MAESKSRLANPCADFLAQYTRCSRRLYGYIRTLVVDVNDANDVFQNSTMCLWEKFSDFTPGTNFYAWACQVARVEVLRFRDHQRRRGRFFSDGLLDLLSAELLARTNELESREQALEGCVERLNDSDRALIERRYSHNESPKEIAKSQARSVFSVYRALGRIHDLLLRCIGRATKEPA